MARVEKDRLIRCCAPHLAALVRFALATGCRAAEITGLEWNRVDLNERRGKGPNVVDLSRFGHA